MTKIQIGWKAKDATQYWYIYDYEKDHAEPFPCDGKWDHVGDYFQLHDHPEQPEIPWDKSLQPVYIEV